MTNTHIFRVDAEHSKADKNHVQTEIGNEIKTPNPRWWVYAAALLVLVVVPFSNAGFSPAQPLMKLNAAARHQNVALPEWRAESGEQSAYLDAPGTVMPFSTVTIHAQIDGELVHIYFKEGETVRAGDLLAEIDSRPYQIKLIEAEAQMARDRASLVNAEAQLARIKELFADKIAAKEDLDNQRALTSQYAGIVKIDQGLIDSARLDLANCRIASPISGRVGLRLVDAGNIVHVGDTGGLVVVTQVHPIAVIINLPEGELPWVVNSVKEGYQLRVAAYDYGFKNQLASGTLLTLDNQIDPATHTAKLKAIFPNEDNRLFVNQIVNTRLLLSTTSASTLDRTISDAY
jgi:membrane fusion protein, multidrug efflux system